MIQIDYHPVYSCAYKSIRNQFGKNVFVLTLTILDDGCQDHDLVISVEVEHVIDHLADCLGVQCVPVFRALRLANAGEQKTQVIGYFGDGPDRRARIVRGRFLLDRDCWR